MLKALSDPNNPINVVMFFCLQGMMLFAMVFVNGLRLIQIHNSIPSKSTKNFFNRCPKWMRWIAIIFSVTPPFDEDYMFKSTGVYRKAFFGGSFVLMIIFLSPLGFLGYIEKQDYLMAFALFIIIFYELATLYKATSLLRSFYNEYAKSR